MPAAWSTAIVVGFIFACWALGGLPPIVDEGLHSLQIHFFLSGQWKLHPELTTLPGYHALIALAAQGLRCDDYLCFRYTSWVLSLGTLAAGVWLARASGVSLAESLRRGLLLAALPILTPYLFLIYTDALALGLLLGALAAALGRSHILAALLAIAAVATRQLNVIWLAAIGLHFLLQVRPWQQPDARKLFTTGLFSAGLLGFLAFVIWNGGVAVGDAAFFPSGKLYSGNTIFALALAGLIFLPINIEALSDWRRAPKATAVGFAVCLLLVTLALVSFRGDNPHNLIMPWIFVHNAAILWLYDYWHRAAIALPLAWTAYVLARAAWNTDYAWLWKATALASLLPLWFIEPRYAIPALALVGLLRARRSVLVETIQTAWQLALAALVIWMYAGQRGVL